jgi:hypothetical protein
MTLPFGEPGLNDLAPPGHLRQLPEDVVARLAATTISELPATPHTLGLELKAAIETRTVHDWRRVANALRHVYGRPGLAQEIEDALSVG